MNLKPEAQPEALSPSHDSLPSLFCQHIDLDELDLVGFLEDRESSFWKKASASLQVAAMLGKPDSLRLWALRKSSSPVHFHFMALTHYKYGSGLHLVC
jgi:hypothetical protein